MGFRQVIELTDPGPHPLAKDAAGADGNITLNRLIPAALTIRPRVPPGNDSHHLVRVGKEINTESDKATTPMAKARRCFHENLV